MNFRIRQVLLTTALLSALTACGADDSPPADPDASGTPSPVAQAADRDCGENAVPLEATLSSGATWSVCFSVESQRGMVLTDVSFTPKGKETRPVAAEMSLAQLEVPYDNGERLTSDITSAGFGGLKMRTLTGDECPDGRVEAAVPNIGDGSKFGDTPTRDVLCSEVSDAGLAYRSEENGEVVADRHDAWSLWTVSKVGWYEYVTRYTFDSDGMIRPELGATGDLSPLDYEDDPKHTWPVGKGHQDGAASHSHNAVWRIHWALDDGPQRVEQYDAKPTGKDGPKSPIIDGRLKRLPRPTTAEHANRRWWRVVAPEAKNDDGHPISYEIDLGNSDEFTFAEDQHHHGTDTGYDVAFTNYDKCQVFATVNRGACGSGVLDYVAESHKPLGDVVSWVAVGFHHVARDEDQSPMQLHWQGFSLMPRDLTSQRVNVPDGRSGYNGQPKEWDGESVEELKRRDDPLEAYQ